MKQIIFIAAGAILLAACGINKELKTRERPVAISAMSLYNTKWLLKKIYTAEGTRDVATKAFIRFDEAKKSAGGNGSCNSFGSNAVINGQSIKLSGIFSTKMYCEGVQPTEDLFLKDLGLVNRYDINGNRLSLYQDKNLLLEFSTE